MRVLRRIVGCINGVDTDGVGEPHHSNRAVSRVMTSGPSMLTALIWNKERPTEWALQVRNVLEALACQVSGHLTPEEMSQFDRCAVGYSCA